MVPWRSSAALFRSYSRSAFSSCTFASSSVSRSSRMAAIDFFSFSQRPRSSASWLLSSASSASSASRRLTEAASVSFFNPVISISIRMALRSISSISTGELSISVRSTAAASSTRSIALSGRKRSAMYLSESTAAATNALSCR
ncbi:hypothetical protein SDC9_176485 [bioreactor metagenome]|uniref:Uncharacterized protein n=1 Tax=bioreactor metagenome TaxID=1076179 RepID=A0A645GQ73_9ZZZZ